MENLTQKNKSSELLARRRKFLKTEVIHGYNAYDKDILKAISKSLRRKKRSRNKLPTNGCYQIEDTKVDLQVKLRCRQLPNLLNQLRMAIMRHEWNDVAILLNILCSPGVKYYSTIILRVCFILLFNHPNSDLSLVQNFIRLSTGYILEEDVNKFIRILFALRKTALKSLEGGKYTRKTGDYRVVRDPEFDQL